MAAYTLYVNVNNGNKHLMDNSTHKIIESFPPNISRWCCPEWDKYLREHKGLDWELRYVNL